MKMPRDYLWWEYVLVVSMAPFVMFALLLLWFPMKVFNWTTKRRTM